MKEIIIGLVLLGTLGSHASIENYSEDQILEMKETEILKQNSTNDLEKARKLSVLKKIKLARESFKSWKKENPNYKEIKKEFKRISNKLQMKGSAEFSAIKNAMDKCKVDTENCQTFLQSNLESIYTNSDIPSYAAKKGFSVLPSAYAVSANFNTCSSGLDHNGQGQFFLGIFGLDKDCGMTFVGPGLGYNMAAYHFQICVGSGRGVNAGVYASGAALFGLGTGVTVGQGGFCQLLSVSIVGANAFAGVVITDDFGGR